MAMVEHHFNVRFAHINERFFIKGRKLEGQGPHCLPVSVVFIKEAGFLPLPLDGDL
jgi:hypothetical protein